MPLFSLAVCSKLYYNGSVVELQIKNIAKIKEANIVIDGITVIAGENNAGKSTVGKALFSLYEPFVDIKLKIRQQRRKYLENNIIHIPLRLLTGTSCKWSTDAYSYSVLQMELDRVMDEYDEKNEVEVESLLTSINRFLSTVKCSVSLPSQEVVRREAKDIAEGVNMPNELIIKEIVQESFKRIFDSQINSLHNVAAQGFVRILEGAGVAEGSFLNHECTEIKSDLYALGNVIYLEDSSVLDKLSDYKFKSPKIGQAQLSALIFRKAKYGNPEDSVFERLLNKEKLGKILDVLESAVKGQILNQGSNYRFQEKGTTFGINFCNLSQGIRSFVVLKMLIERNCMGANDILILDEPEIHLHPQWQIIYAQLIVLLQKEFNLRVLITTHSHFFADALNVYSKKYGTSAGVRFYLASQEERGAVFEEVTGCPDLMYKQMVEAVRVLQALREEVEEV